MADYIERQTALNIIENYDVAKYGANKYLWDLIYEIPPADVKPVVRGRWEIRAYGIDGEDVYCSACECGSNKPYWPFCPMCGSDMRGGDAE